MRVLLGVAGPALIEQDELPGRFEGADHGAGVSFFLARTPPGRGPSLHRHPYEETFVVHEGRLNFTVDGETIEAGAGQIVIDVAGGSGVAGLDGPRSYPSATPAPGWALNSAGFGSEHPAGAGLYKSG